MTTSITRTTLPEALALAAAAQERGETVALVTTIPCERETRALPRPAELCLGQPETVAQREEILAALECSNAFDRILSAEQVELVQRDDGTWTFRAGAVDSGTYLSREEADTHDNRRCAAWALGLED